MHPRHLLVATGVLALCIVPASAKTLLHHRHHAAQATQETSETDALNRQQLAPAGLQSAQYRPATASSVAAEPVSRAMYQRVPGGDPLHAAAPAGTSAMPAGGVTVRN